MSDPNLPMEPRQMEVVAVLRHALQLLDALDRAEEAALVSQALETLKEAMTPVSRAGAE